MRAQGVPQRRPAFFFLLLVAGGRQQTFQVAVQEQGQKEPWGPRFRLIPAHLPRRWRSGESRPPTPRHAARALIFVEGGTARCWGEAGERLQHAQHPPPFFVSPQCRYLNTTFSAAPSTFPFLQPARSLPPSLTLRPPDRHTSRPPLHPLLLTPSTTTMPSHQPVAGDEAVKPEFLSEQPSSMAKTSEPNRNPKYDPAKKHITEYPITRQNWYKHVDWLNCFFIGGIPLMGCIAAFWTPLTLKTLLWSILYYYWTGLGITAGYHRLWSHTSFKATLPLQIFLALVGAGAVEGSIRWWSRNHRAHHRYTDTDKDPYSVHKYVHRPVCHVTLLTFVLGASCTRTSVGWS